MNPSPHEAFLATWHEAAATSLGLFWMAFWAFGLGYLISSMIQVFVTERRMRESMGETGAASVGLGAFFGFVSSSCSFAALATTRALFAARRKRRKRRKRGRIHFTENGSDPFLFRSSETIQSLAAGCPVDE